MKSCLLECSCEEILVEDQIPALCGNAGEYLIRTLQIIGLPIVRR